ncbi:hypothetical protein NA78x_001971 [Anatilimnocola sp. NA78]|uniref:hypothetical protein n=1 Tax=Anatilimnocola sp. NA78 TaxID=3415683 RepID=UPI003CE558CC
MANKLWEIMPPTHLDGALVLFWAEGNFGTCIDDAPVVALAIARYDSDPQIYLFACDKDWRVRGDLAYSSISSAQQDAERYYEVSPIRWQAP